MSAARMTWTTRGELVRAVMALSKAEREMTLVDYVAMLRREAAQ
jgi:hypothetical protein